MRIGLFECAMALTLVASGYAIYVHQKDMKGVAADVSAKAKEDAALRLQLKLEDEKRIAAKNEAWTRCMGAGDRPVTGGLYTVVCIKREAVAWEFRVP